MARVNVDGASALRIQYWLGQLLGPDREGLLLQTRSLERRSSTRRVGITAGVTLLSEHGGGGEGGRLLQRERDEESRRSRGGLPEGGAEGPAEERL